MVGACALAVPTTGSAALKRAPSGFLGVVPQTQALDQDYGHMRAGGIDRIRLYFPRQVIERQPGQFDWSLIDGLVRDAARHRVTVVPFLYGTPEWAGRVELAPRSSGARASFARFAAAAVHRYGTAGTFWNENAGLPRVPITTWQVWNEQNSPKYNMPRVDPQAYGRLVVDAGAAIRSADPSARVVLGGMWGPEPARKGKKPATMPVSSFLKRMHRVRGVARAYDAIAIHPYAANVAGLRKQLVDARTALRRVGNQRAHMLITELGWASGGSSKHPYVKGRKGQAKILTQAMSTLIAKRRKWKIDGVFWYALRDYPVAATFCKWCAQSGLLTARGAAKPAWRAFARFAR